eukprot:ANDGO_03476.mRNA.1 hypothetical protein
MSASSKTRPMRPPAIDVNEKSSYLTTGFSAEGQAQSPTSATGIGRMSVGSPMKRCASPRSASPPSPTVPSPVRKVHASWTRFICSQKNAFADPKTSPVYEPVKASSHSPRVGYLPEIASAPSPTAAPRTKAQKFGTHLAPLTTDFQDSSPTDLHSLTRQTDHRPTADSSLVTYVKVYNYGMFPIRVVVVLEKVVSIDAATNKEICEVSSHELTVLSEHFSGAKQDNRIKVPGGQRLLCIIAIQGWHSSFIPWKQIDRMQGTAKDSFSVLFSPTNCPVKVHAVQHQAYAKSDKVAPYLNHVPTSTMRLSASPSHFNSNFGSHSSGEASPMNRPVFSSAANSPSAANNCLVLSIMNASHRKGLLDVQHAVVVQHGRNQYEFLSAEHDGTPETPKTMEL